MRVARSLVRPSSESLSVLRPWQMWLFDIYFQSVPKRQDVAACQRCIRCNRKAGITVDPAVPECVQMGKFVTRKSQNATAKHVIAMRAAAGQPTVRGRGRWLWPPMDGHGSWRTMVSFVVSHVAYIFSEPSHMSGVMVQSGELQEIMQCQIDQEPASSELSLDTMMYELSEKSIGKLSLDAPTWQTAGHIFRTGTTFLRLSGEQPKKAKPRRDLLANGRTRGATTSQEHRNNLSSNRPPL